MGLARMRTGRARILYPDTKKDGVSSSTGKVGKDRLQHRLNQSPETRFRTRVLLESCTFSEYY